MAPIDGEEFYGQQVYDYEKSGLEISWSRDNLGKDDEDEGMPATCGPWSMVHWGISYLP